MVVMSRRTRAVAAVLVTAALCVCGEALAQPPPPLATERPEVSFIGLTSADLAASDLAECEAAIEQMLGRQTRVRGRAASLALIGESEGVASSLAQARSAAQAGAVALDAFELPKALEELERAVVLYDAALGERLAPQEMWRVHERRAQAFYALRRPVEMRRELARMIALQPSRAIDERVFAPDAVAVFREEAGRVRATTPVPAGAGALGDAARRAGTRFALVGEARLADDGAIELFLTMASVTGEVSTQRARVPRGSPATGLDRVLAPMVEQLGVPKRAAIAVVPPRPPRREPERERPKPLYARWYVWGGVLAAGAVAAYAGSEAFDRPERGGGDDPPPETGVTIEFEPRP